MKTFVRGSISALLLGAVIITGVPRTAAAEWAAPYDAVLYELNENLSLRALRYGQRKATSQLLGFAKAGSPLCPEWLAAGAAFCTEPGITRPASQEPIGGQSSLCGPRCSSWP